MEVEPLKLRLTRREKRQNSTLMYFVSSSSNEPMSKASAALTSPRGGMRGGGYLRRYTNCQSMPRKKSCSRTSRDLQSQNNQSLANTNPQIISPFRIDQPLWRLIPTTDGRFVARELLSKPSVQVPVSSSSVGMMYFTKLCHGPLKAVMEWSLLRVGKATG